MCTLTRLMFGGIHSCTKESPKGSIGEAEVQVLLQVAELLEDNMKCKRNKKKQDIGILKAVLLWIGVYIVIPLIVSVAACIATCLGFLSIMRILAQ